MNKNIGYLFYKKDEYRKALEYYRKAREQAGNESVENKGNKRYPLLIVFIEMWYELLLFYNLKNRLLS